MGTKWQHSSCCFRDFQTLTFNRQDQKSSEGPFCVNFFLPFLLICNASSFSPWYNRSGSLGIKHQVTYYYILASSFKFRFKVPDTVHVTVRQLLGYCACHCVPFVRIPCVLGYCTYYGTVRQLLEYCACYCAPVG